MTDEQKDQTARIAEELRRLAHRDFDNGPYRPPLTSFNLLTEAADLLTAQQTALEEAQGALKEIHLRTGCVCQCCNHGEGSDCGCDCHATGLCSYNDPLESLTRERDEAQRALEETANALAAMTSSAEVADAARRSWKDRAEAAERERDAIEAKWLRVNDMISEVFLTLTAKIATDRSPEAYAAAKDVIRAVLKVAAPGITLEDLIGPMVEEKPCPHVSRTPRFDAPGSQCVQCGEKLGLGPTRTWD